MGARDFGRVADIYDATRSLPEDEMRRVMDALEEAIPHRGLVVDIGVGTGRFAKPLQERGFDVVGIDVSKGMMAKAREKGLAQLVLADIQRIPFRDATFEASIMVHVLHLVDDWVAVVKEAARISRGMFVSIVDTGEGGGRDRLRDEYRELRLREGFPLNRFESGEVGLLELIPPDRLIPVLESERFVEADAEISHLEGRGQSVTWEVPEEVHRRIIASLREKRGGTTLRSKSKMEVAIWSAARLGEAMRLRHQKG